MSAHNTSSELRATTITNSGTNGKIYDIGHAVPTGSTAGFAKGCLYINTAGTTTNDRIYINSGSNTSSTWTNITAAA